MPEFNHASGRNEGSSEQVNNGHEQVEEHKSYSREWRHGCNEDSNRVAEEDEQREDEPDEEAIVGG